MADPDDLLDAPLRVFRTHTQQIALVAVDVDVNNPPLGAQLGSPYFMGMPAPANVTLGFRTYYDCILVTRDRVEELPAPAHGLSGGAIPH